MATAVVATTPAPEFQGGVPSFGYPPPYGTQEHPLGCSMVDPTLPTSSYVSRATQPVDGSYPARVGAGTSGTISSDARQKVI